MDDGIVLVEIEEFLDHDNTSYIRYTFLIKLVVPSSFMMNYEVGKTICIHAHIKRPPPVFPYP